MKHHAAGRPIGKCKGCCLNMKTFCAAALDPKMQWDRGKCPARDDQAILEAYMRAEPPTGAKAARLRRRARAALTLSEPHHNGLTYVPARLSGVAVGKR